MVDAFKNRLGAFARATWFSRGPVELPPHPRYEEKGLHPYKSESQSSCKHEGAGNSFRCDPW